MSRINIHRGKKLNMIAKKKDDIAKHLEAGNEVNAKIWVLFHPLNIIQIKIGRNFDKRRKLDTLL